MPTYRYKTLEAGMKSAHGNVKWTVGKWKKRSKELELCSSGFHCSERIIDAMSYVAPTFVTKVEVRGDYLTEGNKEVWSEMRVVKAYKWTKKDSVALAIHSAELVIGIYEKEYPNDDRPREAIEAAKKVLEHDTAKNRSAAEAARSAAGSAAESAAWSALSAAWSALSAAGSAAESAAESAAKSAKSAAESALSAAKSAKSAAEAARSAAWSAAWSAARSAESAAWSAAHNEILNKIEKWIHQHLLEKE